MDARHLESSIPLPIAYAPLPSGAAGDHPSRRRTNIRLLSLASAAFCLLAVAAFLFGDRRDPLPPASSSNSSSSSFRVASRPVSRGPSDGVSEKVSGASPTLLSASPPYPWTNTMLQWQRTGFHFQPPQNWMNDPNGPLWYEGWYHLFYQYNPDSPVWGIISWGHAVSRDLVHWDHLPLVMIPDRWYDLRGVWTGSATILPTGQIIMLYTGLTNESVQVQNLAVPADPADPLLKTWVKSDSNPVLAPPPGIGSTDFRDPTTAWYDPSDGTWRIAIGSKDGSHAGIAIVYKTRDFVRYELVPGVLHRVPRTGMWECVDFFPVAVEEGTAAAVEGMDTSAAAGAGVRHVLKASLDQDRNDYYAIGTYDMATNTWRPEDEGMDVGIGLRYDWGQFYASKTFYDPEKRRRVLWGWIGETDSERTDLLKGWASLQGIPRTVLFDTKTRGNLLQWPVEEVEKLRMSSKDFGRITIDTGSVFPLDVTGAIQLDIEAEFEIEKEALMMAVEADVGYNCSTSGGATKRGMLGPFGLLVLANDRLSEKTAVYFYIARGTDGNLRTHFCHDELESSRASDIVKRVVGSTVPVLDGETLSVRILVDHSIVESFAQGGRTCITSRVYPTEAIYNAAKVFLFNNATGASVTVKSLTIWKMDSTFSHPYTTQA
ncbi:beta-fructofuranosidase 1-like [Phoenix dactylifera]|uniref:Beta-fructofuranosidase 1-like n=1 Tax=Phoenix dactylifera TaxID=42345 RepID=A0A8B7BJF3_PHODC|nr:beta-fructofuranosidase 1-like [Phoenix dactylifera]